jgi:N-acyl-D-aspartate/D-glutamate deacylase
MTSMPSTRLGLKDRGLIKEGLWADITVFDPEKINDNGTFTNPHQYPDGIPYVIVNGELAIKDGKHTGNLTGRILRKK